MERVNTHGMMVDGMKEILAKEWEKEQVNGWTKMAQFMKVTHFIC